MLVSIPLFPPAGKHRESRDTQLPDCMKASRLHLSTGEVQVSHLDATRVLSAGHANGLAEPQKEAPALQRKASAGQEGPGLLTAARLDPQGKAKRVGSPKDAPAAGTLSCKSQWLVLLAVSRLVRTAPSLGPLTLPRDRCSWQDMSCAIKHVGFDPI